MAAVLVGALGRVAQRSRARGSLRFGPPLWEEAGEEVVAAGAGTEAEPEPPEDEALFGAPMHMCPFLGSPHTLHLYTTMDEDAGQEKKNRFPFLPPRKKFHRLWWGTRNKCR